MMDFLLFFLLLSVAGNVALILIVIGDIKKEREQGTRIRLLEDEVWHYKSKKYRKTIRFLDPHGVPPNRLNEEIAMYQDDGWTFAEQYSVNGGLAFYKEEEIKTKSISKSDKKKEL